MNIPRQHHFTPEIILNNFVDQEGFLHFSRIGWGKIVKKAKPPNLLSERDLYSEVLHDGSLNPALEREYSKLESEFKHVVVRILEDAKLGRAPDLKPEEEELLRRFLYHQLKRSPDYFRRIQGDTTEWDVSIEEAESKLKRALTEEEKINLESKKGVIAKNALISVLADESEVILNVLRKMTPVVLKVPRTGVSFVTGSISVIKAGVPLGKTIHHVSTEFWMPISSDVCIALFHPKESKFIVVEQSVVRRVNRAIAESSSTIVGCSEFLIRSLRNPR